MNYSVVKLFGGLEHKALLTKDLGLYKSAGQKFHKLGMENPSVANMLYVEQAGVNRLATLRETAKTAENPLQFMMKGLKKSISNAVYSVWTKTTKKTAEEKAFNKVYEKELYPRTYKLRNKVLKKMSEKSSREAINTVVSENWPEVGARMAEAAAKKTAK